MKPAAKDDPMEIVGVALPGGDPDLMAECVIEEFLLMGWPEKRLMLLFTQPRFAATHRIYRTRGEAHVRGLIRRVAERWRPVSTRTQGGPGDA